MLETGLKLERRRLSCGSEVCVDKVNEEEKQISGMPVHGVHKDEVEPADLYPHIKELLRWCMSTSSPFFFYHWNNGDGGE